MRPPSRSAPIVFAELDPNAGSTLKSTAASTDTAAVNASAAPLTSISPRRGMPAGADEDQRVRRRVGEQHARDTADEREQRALDEHGSGEPGAASPERHTHGVLAAPPLRAHQKQVGDVAAGDEQHESDGPEHDQQRLARVADDHVAKGANDGAAVEDSFEPARVVAQFVEAGDEATSVAGRSFGRDARREPGDRRNIVTAEVATGRIEPQQHPEIDVRCREVVGARA